MEPQVNINCCTTRPRNRVCCCLLLVIGIFAFLFAFALGVLIGGVTELFTTIGLGAFIVLLTILVAILIALIVYYFCRECRMNC